MIHGVMGGADALLGHVVFDELWLLGLDEVSPLSRLGKRKRGQWVDDHLGAAPFGQWLIHCGVFKTRNVEECAQQKMHLMAWDTRTLRIAVRKS